MKTIISILLFLTTFTALAGSLPDVYVTEVPIMDGDGGIYTVVINQPPSPPGAIWRMAAWGHINSQANSVETTHTGWTAALFDQAAWDSQIIFETGTPDIPIYLFTSGVPGLTDFETLFGPTFIQAAVYWNESYFGDPLVATSSLFNWYESPVRIKKDSRSGASLAFAYLTSSAGDKVICQINSGSSQPITCQDIVEADQDGDSVPDSSDNCTLAANPGQEDADFDGYGNACDPDINGDGIVNFIDLSLFSQVFLSNDEVADFNSDGVVNFIDVLVMSELFFMPPGPSAGF